jgi:four helix bundle protein
VKRGNDKKSFAHERLVVYDKSLEFAALASGLAAGITRKIAASDHLIRATESIPLNIAHSCSAWSPTERIAYLGHANGSALECAACLDVLVARRLLAKDQVIAGKCHLREIVNMLIASAPPCWIWRLLGTLPSAM